MIRAPSTNILVDGVARQKRQWKPFGMFDIFLQAESWQ